MKTLIIKIAVLVAISHSTSAQEHANLADNKQLKQLFANDAVQLEAQEVLKLLKSVNSSLVVGADEWSRLLREDLSNLINASEIIENKCKPDLFNEYVVLMRHVDPKTFRLMLVLDNYKGKPWNENIWNYLKHYHKQQFDLCKSTLLKATENVTADDLSIAKQLAQGVQNNSTQVFAFPFIEPDDIERAVLHLIEPKLIIVNTNDRSSIRETQFEEEFEKIDAVCGRVLESIGDQVQFAQQAYYSYLRPEVDSQLIEWAFYADICGLIRAVSEEQRSEFLETLTKRMDKKH